MKVLFVTKEVPGITPGSAAVETVVAQLRPWTEIQVLALSLFPFQPAALEDLGNPPGNWADHLVLGRRDGFSESIEAAHLWAVHQILPFVEEILHAFGPDLIHLWGPEVWGAFRYRGPLVVSLGIEPESDRPWEEIQVLRQKLCWEALGARLVTVPSHSEAVRRNPRGEVAIINHEPGTPGWTPGVLEAYGRALAPVSSFPEPLLFPEEP